MTTIASSVETGPPAGRLGSSPDPKIYVEESRALPLVSINRVIAEHMGGKAPDVVSIDIEGWDLKVLRSLDFARYRPKVICAETLITSSRQQNPETTPFMASRGYEVRGMTFVNTFYVDKQLL